MKRVILPIALLLLLAGCHSTPAPKPLDQKIGDAHGLDRWKYQDAMAGDIHVAFLDGKQFDAHFTYEIESGRCRMQLADNSVLVYDGKDVWVAPASSKVSDARYDLRVWPLLISLPMQLHAPGAKLSAPEEKNIASIPYDSLTLSFGPGAGDFANSWFTLCADKESHLVKAIGYVLPAGRPLAIAETNPIGITLYNFKQTEGMLFGQDWKIWQYNQKEGIYGLPLGEVRIYNLEFFTPRTNTFTPPAGARREAPWK